IKDAEYQFRIVAQNDIGEGEPSPVSEPVVYKPSQPGEIEILSVFKDSITLEWERPECDGGKDIIGYWVEYRQSGETTWKKCHKERIKDRQFTMGGLLEATEYEFRVFAENETGISRPQIPCWCGLHPSPPCGLHWSSTLLKNSAVISWKPPEDDGGAFITNYVVEKREAKEGAEWQLVSSSISSTTCRIVNLTENAGYYFRVFAQNTFGMSEALEVSSVVVIKTPFEKPGQPTQPIVSAVTKESCVVSWRPPASDGGSKIRNYYLEKREKKQNKWIAVTTEEIHETVYSVMGLIEGLEYEFRVKCENLGGESEWSEVSQPIIPKSDVPIQAPHFKEEIRNLNVKYRGHATFVCKVTGHPKPVVKWFRQGKEIMPEGEKVKIQEFKGGYHQLVITDVTEDDATVYQVRATNQGGSVSGTASLDVEGKQCALLLQIGAFRINWRVRQTVCSKKNNPHPSPTFLNPILFELVFLYLKLFLVFLKAVDYSALIFLFYCSVPLPAIVPARIHLPKNLEGMGAVHALRGEVVSIKIPFSGKPDPVITWQKGQDLIDTNGHYQVIVTRSFTSLVFPNGVDRKDAGFYIVCAKNRFGIDQKTVELDVADVPDPPRGLKASEVSRDSVNLTWNAPANDGGSRVTHYTIEKRATTAERWIRNSEKYEISYHEGVATMYVKDISKSDDGTYRCKVSNDYGEDSSYAELFVKGVREVSDYYRCRTVKKVKRRVDTLRLLEKPPEFTLFSCDIDGEPTPTVTWIRASQAIVSSGRYQVTRTQYKSTFEISSVQSSDEGSYTVVVENSEGRQEAHFTLTVQKKRVPEKAITSPPRGCTLIPPSAKKHLNH
uniref:Titin n=1 Tax=Varanus komodoensis TaxID=61221 RepID=A0A8D2KVM1_VARKO